MEEKVIYLTNNRPKPPLNYTGIVVYPDGTKRWFLSGKRHREDGPAVEAQHAKRWYLHGLIIYTLDEVEEYIVIEDGLPSDCAWKGKIVTQKKVLTATGIKYLPNLPGL
jgi:hypothetical protein